MHYEAKMLELQEGADFIFLTMTEKVLRSFLRASRRSLSARVEMNICHSPKPSALSKYNALVKE